MGMRLSPWELLAKLAALTPGAVLRQSLQPWQRTVGPPPIAPARLRQEAFARSTACPWRLLRLRSPLTAPMGGES